MAFAAYAAHEGQFVAPFVGYDSWQYPWGMVLAILAILAIEVGILHIIIHPKSYSITSPRFGKAFGYSVVLILIFSIYFNATDMPPVFYAPGRFAIVTAALTLLAAAAETVAIEIRQRGG